MTQLTARQANNSGIRAEKMMSEIHKPVIKMIGMGGGGSNAVNRLVDQGLQGVEFIAANTDAQALKLSLAPVKLQLGPRLTHGLGAGGNPKVGEAAAEESYKLLLNTLDGADMVFLTAGLGGGTGTGSIAVAARAAREVGAVTVGVVTTPFFFEVGRRQQNARDGLTRLQPHAHTLITVPNDRLIQIAQPNLTLDVAFQMADDVLRQGIQGIAELVTRTGVINVDFANIRQVIQVGGGALMSIGFGEGESKALKAVEQALHHPLLEAISVESATGIIVNFTGGDSLSFVEMIEAANYLESITHHQAEIVFGFTQDPAMDQRAQVILVVTGLGATPAGPLFTKNPVLRKPESAMPPKAQDNPCYGESMAPVRRSVQMTPLPAAAAPVMMRADVQREPSILPHDIDLPAFMRRGSNR